MNTAVALRDVSKRYRLGAGQVSLGGGVRTLARRLAGRQDSSSPEDSALWALRDVNLLIERGECLGIIGPNGAGKTTILKLLANVTKPTAGTVSVVGRLSALIELGAGFHPDMTGRENVFLNGAILGLSQREIRQRFDAIVAFAEIERFVDTPVKRYSSGMYARLGFAVAAYTEPDVLLVDEVLSVGDMAFQMKCHQRMNELRQNGTTLVFVSHNLKAVQQICSRAVVLNRGQVAFSGPSAEAVVAYTDVLRSNASRDAKPQGPERRGLQQRRMTHGARIARVAMLAEDGSQRTVARSGETVRIRVEVYFLEEAEAPVFACTIRGESGEIVYDTTTRVMGVDTPRYHVGDRVTVEFRLRLHLLNGVYHMAADVAYSDLSCYYDYLATALSFVVVDGNNASGTANLWATVLLERGTPSPEPDPTLSASAGPNGLN